MRERDVRHETFTEKRADPSARAVVELVGHHELLRLEFLPQTAHGARRQDPFDAEHLHRVDVRAKVQLARQQPVPGAVAREKRDAPAAQRRQNQGRRRLAERGVDDPFLAIGQLGHVVQAAAANDANSWCGRHRLERVGLGTQLEMGSTHSRPASCRMMPAVTTGSCSKKITYSPSTASATNRRLYDSVSIGYRS